MNLPDLSDDKQLAEALGCEPETVQQQALAGVLPGVKFGRGWVFPREAVLEALNRAARLQAEKRAVATIKPGAVSLAAPTSKRRRSPPALPDLR